MTNDAPQSKLCCWFRIYQQPETDICFSAFIIVFKEGVTDEQRENYMAEINKQGTVLSYYLNYKKSDP